MRQRTSRPLLSSLLLVTLAAVAPAAAQLQPAGVEHKISRGAVPIHNCPAVAPLADGTFLVVWTPPALELRFGCSPDGKVFGRRVSAEGSPLGAPFAIATAPNRCISDLQAGPEVDGRLVVTWNEAEGQLGLARTVAASVSPAGGAREILRRANPPGLVRPELVPLRSGGLLAITLPVRPALSIVYGFDAQLFDAAGAPLGARFPIVRIPGVYRDATAAETSPGVFVVAWSVFEPSSLSAVLARRFDTAGRPLGPAFRVAPPERHPGTGVLAAGDDSGRFAVVWTEFEPQGDFDDAAGRIFGPDGTPASDVFAVNLASDGSQEPTGLDLSPDGEAVVLWNSSRRSALDADVVGRTFGGDGRPLGRALRLSANAAGNQLCGRLAGDGRGGWLAVWAGNGPQGQGLYARALADPSKGS